MHRAVKGFIPLLLLLCLIACSQREGLAPVIESNWRAPIGNKKMTHTVQRGETLYAIAFRYDKDYRSLAQINHLQSPYTLKIGQVVNLKTSHPHTKKLPTYSTTKSTHVPQKFAVSSWQWPVRGKILEAFSPSKGHKGIEIAGKKGASIYAASSGVVAYAGDGLSGYGNLIIIKHNNQFLTAYGNNAKLFVREGQVVKKGQRIASMGLIDRRYWGVHFEIRKAGKPVNPLNYLKKE